MKAKFETLNSHPTKPEKLDKRLVITAISLLELYVNNDERLHQDKETKQLLFELKNQIMAKLNE